jgi:anti-anti-sigma factor
MDRIIINRSKEDKTITIDVEGTFDYRLHRDFRSAYREELENFAYIINLNKTEYMDSAALGMLLLLREHAGGDEAKITITGCRPTIRKTFSIAQFDQLFTIR